MGRTIIAKGKLSKHLWDEVINAEYCILSQAVLRSLLKMTLYKLWKLRKSRTWHFKVFGRNSFVLNVKVPWRNVMIRLMKLVLGYSENSKAWNLNVESLLMLFSLKLTLHSLEVKLLMILMQVTLALAEKEVLRNKVWYGIGSSMDRFFKFFTQAPLLANRTWLSPKSSIFCST